MAKRIVLGTDGTWDSVQSATNVYKITKLAVSNAGQVVLYEDGVGADGTPLEKLAGGALGDGLCQKIMDGYSKISHVYEKDDDIFLFGFSRGAYTARSLAGMIAYCGLPLGSFDDGMVQAAFAAYRSRDAAQFQAFTRTYQPYDAKLKLVGAWDTVGSLGIPALFGQVASDYGFLDTQLHPDVLNARHALSLDEKRQEFPPTLWNVAPLAPGRTLKQAWFSGVHCDVGGGYPETSLSDITLAWMTAQAAALGLIFDPAAAAGLPLPADKKFALGVLHESWSPLWMFPKRRTVASDAVLANSIAVRCVNGDGYQPQNLTLASGTPAPSYGAESVVA